MKQELKQTFTPKFHTHSECYRQVGTNYETTEKSKNELMKRTLTFCLFLILFSSNILGQKKDINLQFINALKAGNVDEMMVWIDKGADVKVVDKLIDKTLDIAYKLEYLASLYEDKENYAKAEQLYLAAIKIRKTILGENHPSYASSLSNLVIIYEILGDDTKAESIYNEIDAIEKRKKSSSESRPENENYITNLTGLTKTELNTRLLQEAENTDKYDIEWYLKLGADVNTKNEKGQTALHLAAQCFNHQDDVKDIIMTLIKYGANINMQDVNGLTPAMLAVNYRNFRTCYYLYKSGADLYITSRNGKTALDIAEEKGYTRIAQFIRNPNSYNEEPTVDEYQYLIRKSLFEDNYSGAKTFLEFSMTAFDNELNLSIFENSIVKYDYLYEIMDDFEKHDQLELVEPIFMQSLKNWSKTFGKMDTLYAYILDRYKLFYGVKYFQKSTLLYEEELNIYKALYDKNLSDKRIARQYSNRLKETADFYLKLGDFVKAEPLIKNAVNIEKGFKEKDYYEIIELITEYASIQKNIGNYQRAEQLYELVINLLSTLYHEDLSASFTKSGLETFYFEMGNYQKILPYYEKYFTNCTDSYKSENIPCFRMLDKLSLIYHELGFKQKEDSLYRIAISGLKNISKNQPKKFGGLITSFVSYNGTEKYGGGVFSPVWISQKTAEYYVKLGDYQNARIMCDEVLKNITSAKSEIINFEDCQSRYYYNLSHVYIKLKDYNLAIPLLKKSIKIIREQKKEKDENEDYYNKLENLAILYTNVKNYHSADSIYVDLCKTHKELSGEKGEKYKSILISYAMLKTEMKDFQLADTLFKESMAVIKKQVFELFSAFSEQDRKVFWDKEKGKFENIYPSFAYKYYPDKPSISNFAYDNALFTKGLLLNTSVQIQNAILQSGDSTLIASWYTMRSLKQQIKILESKPLAEQIGLQTLENQADSIDKVLTKKSQLYKQSQPEMQQQWTDVQNNLQPDEAAIEFVSFRYYNKQYTDSTLNYALVLKKNSPYPVLIPLFENKQLDSLFVQSSSNVNQLYTFRLSNSRKDNEVRELNYGEKLYDLVWKPLEKSLQGIKTVYYSPSGKLNQVSFAAIPVDSTLLLCDKYNLYQVTCTREVIKNNTTKKTKTANTPKQSTHQAVLFGGIQYDLDDKQLAQVQTTSNEDNSRSIFVNDSNQRSGSFGYLKGSADEVNTIHAEFKKNGSSSQLLTGVTANEAQFKHLTGTATEVIHIATHGFYLPVKDTRQEEFRFMGMENNRRNVLYQNPLLRSGLIFAGANKAWIGESIPANWEDGILTAQEITQLNLTKTQLVVLSACETGLGDDGGSEGVFGLQRSFKMAGVQTLIISLWKVPDTQTSQLMQGFYKYWLSGMTKHDAFKKAQNEIKKANPNPYYWAAFVMVD